MLRIELSDYKNRTYLSAIEAAKYLNISVDILHNLANKQVIKTQIATSGQMRFDLKELKKYEKTLKFKPRKRKIDIEEVNIIEINKTVQKVVLKNSMKMDDLKDFVECYNPDNRFERKQTWSEKNPDGRWRCYTYGEILKRDKTNLDIFWIKDESLDDLDKLPSPEVIAAELVEELENALEQLKETSNDLSKNEQERD